MTDKRLNALLRSNPQAKRDEKLIRDVLSDLRRLEADGLPEPEGYQLMPPFGERKALTPGRVGLRSKFKMT
jgi:hypothetical protein